jgi:hypothetical protein
VNAAATATAATGKEEEEQRKREEKAKEVEFEAYFRRRPVTLDALFDCPDVLEKIQRWFVSRGKNKYTIHPPLLLLPLLIFTGVLDGAMRWYHSFSSYTSLGRIASCVRVSVVNRSFEIVSTEHDVAFLMVNANPQGAQDRLDGILAKPRKFVCINDDIDHSAPESVETLSVPASPSCGVFVFVLFLFLLFSLAAGGSAQIIRRFYESMYPLRSTFELPEGRANLHLHMSDLLTVCSLFMCGGHAPDRTCVLMVWRLSGACRRKRPTGSAPSSGE